MREYGLKVGARIYETEANQSHSCGSFGAYQPRLNSENVGVKEPVSLIVIRVILPIECQFNMKDVRAGKPWDQSANFLIVNPLTLDINCVLIFTELDPQVLAHISIGASEVFPIQFNILLNRVFNRTIGRADRDNSRGVVVCELVRLSFQEHLLPILVIERKLKDSFGIQFCRGSSP